MKASRLFMTGTAAVLAAAIAMSAPGRADAKPRPPIGPCIQDCRVQREECAHACTAAMVDCMRGPRAEMRICRDDCTGQFAEETPELAACVLTCRENILAPAIEECRPQRQECVSLCAPGPCAPLCAPGGGDETGECRAGCAAELRVCAKEGKGALRECLAPCFQLTEQADREVCGAPCVEAAVAGAAICREGYQSCNTGCTE